MNSSSSSPPSSLVHDLCNAAVDYTLQHVNTIQFIIKSIEQISGETFSRDRIRCMSFPQDDGEKRTTENGLVNPKSNEVSAGYMWRDMAPRNGGGEKEVRKGDIVLLEKEFLPSLLAHKASLNEANGSFPASFLEKYMLSTLNQVEKNLRHELIHAFDDTRGEIHPWNCLHQACSEIRAARLSGDCFTGEEIKNWRFNFFKNGKECVRRRAILAVETNPLCRGFSERAVEKVFSQCYFDYEPFVAPIYTLGSYGADVFENGTLSDSSSHSLG